MSFNTSNFLLKKQNKKRYLGRSSEYHIHIFNSLFQLSHIITLLLFMSLSHGKIRNSFKYLIDQSVVPFMQNHYSHSLVYWTNESSIGLVTQGCPVSLVEKFSKKKNKKNNHFLLFFQLVFIQNTFHLNQISIWCISILLGYYVCWFLKNLNAQVMLQTFQIYTDNIISTTSVNANLVSMSIAFVTLFIIIFLLLIIIFFKTCILQTFGRKHV